MVELGHEARLDRMFDTILPAIVDHEDLDFQLEMLDKKEVVTNDLNIKCGYRVADIPQIFEDLREKVREKQKEVERIKLFV